VYADRLQISGDLSTGASSQKNTYLYSFNNKVLRLTQVAPRFLYRFIDVYSDRLQISGDLSTGAPRELALPPKHRIPPTATPASML